MAQYIGTGRCGRQLADTVERGQVQRLDLAAVDGRWFSLVASAGFDAEVVHQVHSARHGHINKLSYIGPILRSLRTYRFPLIAVDIAETGERLHGALVFVFNTPQYGLGLPIAREAQGDDGWLDLWVFEYPGVTNLLDYLAAVLRGYHGRRPDVHHRRVCRVHLSAQEPVPLQIDGDPGGHLPVTIEIARGCLSLLVPSTRVSAAWSRCRPVPR
jgi:diacylglycerol kinase family enzyme